jgi:tRNA-2-methylthio-N6-dimethylallyladenosine synthase
MAVFHGQNDITASPADKRVLINTFGCQMNEYDSSRMAGLLAGLGYALTQEAEQADLILLNTCSVREHAAHKVYSYVGALKPLKEKRPGLIIGVGGCLAQQEGQHLLDSIPHLDLVFGTDAIERLPDLIAEAIKGKRRSFTPRPQKAEIPVLKPPAWLGLKAMVTVMQGCDNFCSYCVVPYVRGRERSRPASEILAEIAALTEAGVREVTLLGQNVNSYKDPEDGLDFPGLLAEAVSAPGLWRLRFTTSHPKDLSPRLIEVMASEDKIMEQLHLPVQSGSDRVLKAMRRGYNRAEYLAKVTGIRQKIPGIALGSDIIVGFPGESEEDFAATLSLLDEVGYDFLFSFKYSDRPHTKALKLKHKLSDEIKAERLEALQARQREISLAGHRAMVGETLEVLVEGPAKKGQGQLTGRCRSGQAVNFAGPPDLKGRLVQVLATEGLVHSLKGRLLTPEEGAIP